MEEVKCIIDDLKEIYDKSYYSVTEVLSKKSHIIPKYQIEDNSIIIGKEYIFIKEFNKQSKKEFLKYPCKLDFFKIIGAKKYFNKKQEQKDAFIVAYKGERINVSCFNWQKPNLWKHKELKCSIERYSKTGIPILKNMDFRHPCFVLGKVYDFEVIKCKKRVLLRGEIYVYILKGIDTLTYEVHLVQGQLQQKNEGKTIRCKIVEISHVVKLMQVDFNDPFYVDINSIVSDRELVSKYFIPIINDVNEERTDEQELVNQYNSKSAFWVFTFTNKILLRKYNESLARFDYNSASQINKLIQIFEDWIISKGIIRSIKDELLKARTLAKANQQLKRSKTKAKLLNFILNNEFNYLEIFLEKEDFNVYELYLLIGYSNQKFLNDKILCKIILLFCERSIFKTDLFFTKELQKLLNNKKKIFLDEIDIESFNIITRKLGKTEQENNNRYLNWSYFEYLILLNLEDIQLMNICASQIVKGLSLNEQSFDTKQNLLLNAYNYLEYYEDILPNPFKFVDNVVFNYSVSVIDKIKTKEQQKVWTEIQESEKSKKALTVFLRSKSSKGYEVYYKGIKGFLPLHHVTDKSLKHFGFDTCDFKTNVYCISANSIFNYFIVKQFDKENGLYYLKQNGVKNVKVGDILKGKIKAIKNYGIFIITEFNEGLLHISEIFDFYWNKADIFEYFSVGDEIKIKVIKIDLDSKISFSLKDLKIQDKEYYDSFVKQLTIGAEDDSFDARDSNKRNLLDVIQNEKALCFEQLALFQKDITEKLKSFRIAKQLYSNTNHARSYLINIYTTYFEILLKLISIVEIKNLSDLEQIRSEAVKVDKKINIKTLEIFPETNTLKIFLRIIQLFNSDSNESIKELYNYVEKYSIDDSMTSLRTISKITLSNNLMTSEICDNKDYVFKNLNILIKYLANGILTLSESDKDKFLREKEEKCKYFKNLIESDESETLEFKSSIFVPHPGASDLNKLKELRRKDQNPCILKQIDNIIGVSAKKSIIYSAFKNISAFANTNGGILLIGVNDDKSIRGIESEFSDIPEKKKDKDGYGLAFAKLLKSYFGNSCSSILETEYIDFPEGTILVVKISSCSSEVFILKDKEGKKTEELFVRNLSSAERLEGKALTDFVRNKLNKDV